MTTILNTKETLLTYLNNYKIATMDAIKAVLNTQSRMTVFRRLSKLDYISSCSHRGKYYLNLPDRDFAKNNLLI